MGLNSVGEDNNTGLMSPRSREATEVGNVTSGGLEYTLYSDNTAKLTGFNLNEISGNVIIAENINNGGTPYKITKIDDQVLEDFDGSITSIKIPVSVEEIGMLAFNIGLGLQSITVDDNNKNYASDNGVLFGLDENGQKTNLICCPAAKKGEYKIPNGVKSIDMYAFCFSKLTSLTIPKGVEKIGECAFAGSSGLVSITIPGSVREIGPAIISEGSSVKSVTIENSIETIDTYAFGYCISLKNIEIPAKVGTIGEDAFSGCSNLTNIEIPANVKVLGPNVFEDCTNLETVKLDRNSEITEIPKYAFSGCSSLKNIEIPAKVGTIGEYAFSGCINLANKKTNGTLIIPKSVTTLGSNAFNN